MLSNKLKRTLSFLMALTLVASMLPVPTRATETEHQHETLTVTETEPLTAEQPESQGTEVAETEAAETQLAETVPVQTETVPAASEETTAAVNPLLAEYQAEIDRILNAYLGTTSMTAEEIAAAVEPMDFETYQTARWEISLLDDEIDADYNSGAVLDDELELLVSANSTFLNFHSALDRKAANDPEVSLLESVNVLSDQITVTGSYGTTTASGNTVTLQGTSGRILPDTNNITIKNNTANTVNISFDYSVEGSTLSNGFGNTSGSYSTKLAAGASTTIAVYIMAGKNTVTVTLTNFKLVQVADPITVKFQYNSDLGSITVAGTAIANEGSATIPDGGAVLAASAKSNAEFIAWVNTTNNTVLSVEDSFSLLPQVGLSDVQAVFVTTTADTAWYLAGGDKLLNDFTEAVSYAAASTDNNMVVLMNNATMPTGTYTVSDGVTFLIPYSDSNYKISASTYTDDSGNLNSTWIHANNAWISDNYDNGSDSDMSVSGILDPAASVFRTLTIPSGTTLNVESGGKFVIGGTIVSGSLNTGGICGATAGAHGNVTLNGTLSVSGILSTCGYILGSGNVNVTGGSVYQPFTLTDYHDGHHTVNCTKNGTFPANRYTMQNIQAPITFSSGGRMHGYIDIYTQTTASVIKARHNVADQIIIGRSSDAALLKLNDGATLTSTYDSSDYVSVTSGWNAKGYYAKLGKHNVTISGGASLGSIDLIVNVAGTDYTVHSYDTDFPVSYQYDFTLKNGTYTLPYNLALLPGATMTVASDANLVVSGGSFVVFDGLRDHTSRAGTSDTTTWYEYHYPSTTDLKSKGYSGTANLIIDGTFTVNSGASFGGYIQTNGHANSKVTMNGTPKATAGIGNVIKYGGIVNGYAGRTERTLSAWLYEADNELIALETGDIYHGVGSDTHNIASYAYKVYTVAGDTSTSTDLTVTLNANITGSWCTADGHSYNSTTVDPTCGDAGSTTYTCSACGYSYSEAGEPATGNHNYSSGVTTPPSCDTQGVKTYTCSVCGDSYTEAIAATGHSYTSKVTAPTCTEQGYTTHTCSNCGGSYKDTYTAALGHTPGAEATCTTAQTCTVCGATITEALGHTPGAAATCTGKQTCTVCGATVKEALGHNYEAVVTDPTCTAGGYTTYTCSRCQDSYIGDEVAATGHNYEEKVTTAAGCTTDGVKTFNCNSCGDSYAEAIPATGHNYEDAMTNPTCTKGGYTTYTCSCGDSYTADEVAALGHTAVVDEAVEATCTATGLTEGSHCSVCDEILVAQETISAPGHTAGDAVVENSVDPTCTADGSYDNVVYCTVCGAEISRGTTSVPATGHTPGIAVIENNTSATCSEGGSYDSVVYCSVCGAEISRTPTTVAALGHSYETVVTKPTCTEAGYTTYTCSVCGDTYTSDEVAAFGHDYEVTETKPATCTEDGLKYSCCKNCGDNSTVGIPATGHNYEAVVTAPTCNEAGYTTYTCSVCDDTYVSDWVTALGHTAGDTVVENNVAPTCTATGSYDSVVYCTVCDAEISRETVTVDALGHKYDAVVTAPTCTEAGYTTYTCSVCDDSYVSDQVDALGHTDGETVVENNVAPTCTATGSHDNVTYCTVCGEETSRETVTVDALGHDYDAVVTAPTCTEAGYTTYTCSVCGDTYTADEIAATGHDYKSVVTAPSFDEQGYTTYTCSVCRDSYVADYVDALIAVAEVNGIKYKTLPDAVADAESDAVVTLLADVTLDSRLAISKKLTLNLNGKIITANFTDDFGPIYVGLSGDLTVTGNGTIVSEQDIVFANYGKITIESGTFRSEAGEDGYNAALYNMYYNGSSYGTAEINGGTFESEIWNSGVLTVNGGILNGLDNSGKTSISGGTVNGTITAGDGTDSPDLEEKATISITGGTFENPVEKTWCADGYGPSEKDEYGYYGVHKHDYQPTVTAPTCTEAGYTTYTCSVCDDSYVSDQVDALGHTDGETVVENEVAATCTATGSYDNVTYCTVCGEETSRETVTVDALGHTEVVDVAVAPDCTNTGLTEGKHCSICDEVLVAQTVVDALGHRDNDNDHNCDACGKKISECINSDPAYGGSTLPLPDDQLAIFESSSFFSNIGTVELLRRVEFVTELVEDADFFTQLFESEEFLNFMAETFGLTPEQTCVKLDELAANLMASGDMAEEDARNEILYNFSVLYAAEWLTTLSTDDAVNFLANPDSWDTIYANMTENRQAALAQSALVYGMYLSYAYDSGDQARMDKLDSVNIVREAFEDEEFLLYMATSETVADVKGFLAAMRMIDDCTSDITAVEHLLVNGFDDPELADAIDSAVENNDHNCDICGATMTDCIDSNSNHKCDICGVKMSDCSWNNGEVTTKASCTENGVKTYTCTICGTTKSETIEANGHTAVTDAAVAPTCTTTGLTEGSHCDVCSEVLVAQEEVSANGHSYDEGTVTKPATCEEDGTKTYTCSVCGDTDDIVISATGHSYESVVTAPTCTEAGYTTNTCTACGDSYKSDEVDALGHTEVIDEAIDATCTESGKTEGKHCSVCNEVLTAQEDILPTGEHTYVDGVCSMCGTEEPVELIKLSGTAMTLGSSLSMDFGINTALLENGGEGHYAIITRHYADGTSNDIVRVDRSEWASLSGSILTASYRGLAAKEMCDTIDVVVYNAQNQVVSYTYTDSIRDYATRQLNNTANAKKTELLTVLVDMLNYGAAAQEQFNYNKADLANANLTEIQKGYATADVAVQDAREKGTGYAGTTLTLKSEILLDFVFYDSVIGTDYTGMYAIATYTNHYGNTKTVRLEEFKRFNSTMHYVSVNGMSVADCGQVVSCTVYNSNGEAIASAKDSAEGYVARQISSGQTNAIYMAIMKFANSAYNYFH